MSVAGLVEDVLKRSYGYTRSPSSPSARLSFTSSFTAGVAAGLSFVGLLSLAFVSALGLLASIWGLFASGLA